MNKNLKDFAKNYNMNNYTDEQKNTAQKQTEQIINTYKNLSQNDLSNALLQEVAKQKGNGTFDKHKLLQMLENIKTLLPSEEQYEKIKDIINSL